jgi:RIO-like serine/threonine protein kinase
VWLEECERFRDALTHGEKISSKEVWWLPLTGYREIEPYALAPKEFKDLLCLSSFGLKIPMPISSAMKEAA